MISIGLRVSLTHHAALVPRAVEVGLAEAPQVVA